MNPRRLGIAIPLLYGLIANGQVFEVASIKPADPAGNSAIARSGNRLIFSNMSLEMLIKWAFDIGGDRLVGRPKWLDSPRYDIEAKGPDQPPAIGGYQLMMQSLLATRFKLAVHRETRQLSIYALVVDKNGPKVHVEAARGEMGQNPFSMPGRGRLSGVHVTADMLAKVLSDQLGRSVQDKTGIDGVFDFKLEWVPDTPPPFAGADNSPAGPSIFTAIQEQLGFKLESRKGAEEVLVIDHIENAPTEN